MNILLQFPYAPGDCWVLTRMVRDFAWQFPGDCLYPATSYNEAVFGNSPYYHEVSRIDHECTFRFDEPAIGGRRSFGNSDVHDSMASVMYEFMEKEGWKVRMETMAPDWHPTELEARYSLVPLNRPVCILNAGYKSDNLSKAWGHDRFQEVVSALKDRVDFVQVGMQRPGFDWHAPIEGAMNLLGETTQRDLAQLVYHADFVLTGVSQLHHLAGIQCYKPRHCFTLAGAREPENWANCHIRKGVEWHWFGTNAAHPECMEADCSFHKAPGCWHSVCPKSLFSPAPCLAEIEPGQVIAEMEKCL